jgi:hypothetical protein
MIIFIVDLEFVVVDGFNFVLSKPFQLFTLRIAAP